MKPCCLCVVCSVVDLCVTLSVLLPSGYCIQSGLWLYWEGWEDITCV